MWTRPVPWSASRSAGQSAGTGVLRKSALAAAALAAALATSASPAAALVQPSGTGPLPVTAVTVNGAGGDRLYQGVGAVLGGGGNARYLMDYPEPERGQILDYLFKPGYGAALQLLKLEIGGGANSTDGAEPSVEPVRGQVNCDAGYEFSIARQAVARNPGIRLYGLQWTAPGWAGQGTGSVFTRADIGYLLTWLGCAARHGLTISYLGGWNESDNGTHAAWFGRLRQALDAAGYRSVQLVAADANPTWEYVSNPPDPDIAVLGTHDVCGYPTGVAGPATRCYAPATAIAAGQPLWASELGAMDAGAQPGCVQPCAPAMDRAVLRGYLDARLTGFLEWPALDAMPPGLPYENRGLVTADQPWSGHYRVNAMTWAIAQLTQVAWPPWPGNPGGWRYLDSASGFLQGDRADGSYVTLVRHAGTGWSMIIESTTARAPQQVSVRVTGGQRLAGRTVHVWASDFSPDGSRPAAWFARQPSIRPASGGAFTFTVQPGWVYSLTTTSGQGQGRAAGPGPAGFPLPYRSSLGSAGPARGADDEPAYLAAQDGSFQLARCGTVTCTRQTTVPTPIFWANAPAGGWRYPYATVGGAGLANYSVSVDTLLTQPGTSAGLIGRFSQRGGQSDIGHFDGYLFDVAASGAWVLVRNHVAPGRTVTLAAGRLPQPLGTGRWHRLSLAMTGPDLTAAVDGRTVAAVSDQAWTAGLAGIEAGAGSGGWPQAEYRDLAIIR
jgi:Glycosyl hydrolase family 59